MLTVNSSGMVTQTDSIQHLLAASAINLSNLAAAAGDNSPNPLIAEAKAAETAQVSLTHLLEFARNSIKCLVESLSVIATPPIANSR